MHSPQYVLWLLPFFVLLRISVWWWAAYSRRRPTVYVGVFRWFYDFGFTNDVAAASFPKTMLIGGVWLRATAAGGPLLRVPAIRGSLSVKSPQSFVSQPPS